MKRLQAEGLGQFYYDVYGLIRFPRSEVQQAISALQSIYDETNEVFKSLPTDHPGFSKLASVLGSAKASKSSLEISFSTYDKPSE